jgi:hypothetical protein
MGNSSKLRVLPAFGSNLSVASEGSPAQKVEPDSGSARERPILFSAPMVRALLEGRKTQTRRPVTRLCSFGPITEFGASTTRGYDWHFRNKRMLWNDISTARLMECCPYGKPGDRLWVRETFGVPPWSKEPGDVAYRADLTDDMSERAVRRLAGNSTAPWTPSIHMPRWASRITLEVTGVRVQRLQDISEEDARAEGVTPSTAACSCDGQCARRHRDAYALLWDSINGAGAWAANPWVWCVSFRRLASLDPSTAQTGARP